MGLRRQWICGQISRQDGLDRGRNRAQRPRSGRPRGQSAALGSRAFLRLNGRNRKLAKDFEAIIDPARVFPYAASVMLLVRLIAWAS